MVLPPQDALALINEELSQIQEGALPLSPSPAEAPVPPSTALAAPATSVDIDMEFDALLTELEEDEAADMDVDITGTTAQGRTQVLCSMCRDFGYLVACTATGCNTQICYQRQDSAALPCLNDPSVGRFAKFRCPPCHRKQGTTVDYKLNSPPNLSLARKLVPLLLVNVIAEGVSVYTQQMSNHHFQNAFGTSEEWYLSKNIWLSSNSATLRENVQVMIEMKKWKKEHPDARLVVLLCSHSNMIDGTIIWGRHKLKKNQAMSSPLSSVLDKFLGDLLPRNTSSPGAIFVLMSCGTALTARTAAADFMTLARERFACAVGFTAPTIISNQVFVHVLPLLNALVMGESAEMALRASLFSPQLLRQSAVVYTFRDDQNVLQVRYVFLVVTNYHPHPLGLRLLCPTCRSSLLGKNKRNARENHRWRFKCETCMKQTAWLTPEGHHFVGPSDSTYFYREYPAPDTYSKLIHGATWNIIDSSA